MKKKQPDSNTTCNFIKEQKEKGLGEEEFHDFGDSLFEKCVIFNNGQIDDASFVLAPRQSNIREENMKIKEGQGEELWYDNPNKKHQKDINASWKQKCCEDFFGYNAIAEVDGQINFIKKIVVDNVSLHNSKKISALIDESNMRQIACVDSVYVGQEESLQKFGRKDQICEKGYRCMLFGRRTQGRDPQSVPEWPGFME